MIASGIGNKQALMGGGEQATWGEVWAQLQVLFWLYAGNLGPAFSPLNVLATLSLCLVLWVLWKPGPGFFSWVFPARIYARPSFRVDLKLMVLNWFIDLFARMNYAAIATITAFGVGQALGLAAPGPEERSPILSALVVFLVGDLALYWYHRLNHGRPVLWAFHALHHSAEEMSPVTAFRHHPIYSITAGLIVSAAVGVAQGLAMALFLG
ncbi:MAG: sterol desaturase family protein, partial [Rhodobacterales bacterium]|nr:sterol desaturase family protein [Rhodobacterales bacterium]